MQPQNPFGNTMQCSSLSAVIGRVNAMLSYSPIPAHHLLLTAFTYLGITLVYLSELNSAQQPYIVL